MWRDFERILLKKEKTIAPKLNFLIRLTAEMKFNIFSKSQKLHLEIIVNMLKTILFNSYNTHNRRFHFILQRMYDTKFNFRNNEKKP